MELKNSILDPYPTKTFNFRTQITLCKRHIQLMINVYFSGTLPKSYTNFFPPPSPYAMCDFYSSLIA